MKENEKKFIALQLMWEKLPAKMFEEHMKAAKPIHS